MATGWKRNEQWFLWLCVMLLWDSCLQRTTCNLPPTPNTEAQRAQRTQRTTKTIANWKRGSDAAANSGNAIASPQPLTLPRFSLFSLSPCGRGRGEGAR
jgi:hypothetical protein